MDNLQYGRKYLKTIYLTGTLGGQGGRIT
ncbi:hypothetical protein AAY473_004867 [Plecturocebus cupreus]